MKIIFVILLFLLSMFSCEDTPYNPNIPDAYINFSIEPNSTFYYELNTVSGWMYVSAPPQSRGIIIYRYSMDEFRAYERQSPNDPNHCGEYSRLIVDFPFVVDTCLDVKYSILDGQIITEGYNGYPLIQYHTQYDGNTLRVFNK
ncbi:MAG: hypothetical protein J6R17_03110 [Bacteroidales bacterium]|nr:hypothetical protein [Bacteroidales bacterium]